MDRINLTGKRFGRLVVTGFNSMAPNRVSIWDCICDCGTVKKVRRTNLYAKGGTKSCGCYRRDMQRKRQTTHGEFVGKNRKRSKEHACWDNMKQRCTNPKHQRYESYGAKGVTVCSRWLDSFELFLADVGRAPEDKPYIDRINAYGNYEPGNVRWTDLDTSNANKR